MRRSRVLTTATVGGTTRPSVSCGQADPGAIGGRQLTIRATGPWPEPTTGVGRLVRVGRTPSEVEVPEFGWRAAMAAAFIASRVPTATSFTVLTPGKTIPPTATDWLQAPLRGGIGAPVGGGASTSLDKLSKAAAWLSSTAA